MNEMGQIPQLLSQLSDFKTRPRARRELEKMGSAAAEPLLRFLGQPGLGENARWVAIDLLGQLRCTAAAPALLDILRNEVNLRNKAGQALQAITGLELGEDVDAWVAVLRPAEVRATAPAAVISGPDNAEFRLVREAVADLVLELTWEEPGYVYLRCRTEDGRGQQLVITFETDPRTAERNACIYTECGPATPAADGMITRRNVTVRYGEFGIEKDADGKSKVVLRARIPMKRVNPELLRDAVGRMAQEADSFEYELHQTDRL